jgi:chromate transporter
VNWFLYFLLFLKASTFSFGGMSNLASLQRDLPIYHWAHLSDFGKAVAIGQVSPGPNGLWVVSLGYLTYGIPGAAMALLAITIPPFLILPLNTLYRRLEEQRWMEALLRSLVLVSVGLLLSSAWSILAETLQDRWSIPICLMACVLCITRRLGALALILLAACAGFLFYGLHF